jgi:glutamate-1-semialdehyde 2,1-aminomutase/spore coat polysaccharide biosynthesis protein SpsF
MANGMPISALVGKQDIMEGLGEVDGAFWSGTFFGEALSLAAAIATVDKLRTHSVLEHLWTIGKQIRNNVQRFLIGRDDISISGEPPRSILTFTNEGVREKFMQGMIAEGVLIINSNNVCFSMGENEVDRVITAYERVL